MKATLKDEAVEGMGQNNLLKWITCQSSLFDLHMLHLFAVLLLEDQLMRRRGANLAWWIERSSSILTEGNKGTVTVPMSYEDLAFFPVF